MDEDRNLLKRMDELEESMKLIVATLNIGGVDNQGTIKENFEALGGNNYVENPMKDNALAEPHNKCVQQKLKENKVIVGTVIAERMDWKWREEHKSMKRNVGFFLQLC